MKNNQNNTQILIVDDEELVRRLLTEKLTDEGYQCRQAGNADQALDTLESEPFDLVLLDIKMPGKSGIELLSDVKTGYPDIAVIMATALTDTNYAVQCMKEGAFDYLIKPFNLDEVTLSISRALEKRKLELENRDYHLHLEQRVTEQANEIRQSYLNAITALAHALEAKDKYTSGHSQRVSDISVAIAEELGMPTNTIEKIRLAGLLHDIGKIGVNEAVLHKPTDLTPDEFNEIKSHCEKGERILSPVIKDAEILDMVRHHHEWYNGSGYPDGLSGDHTLLSSKILVVSDAYDAMTSERPYREAMSEEDACAEIERARGTQFDPEVVDAFLKVINNQLKSKDITALKA
jgi:putative two-component system response regulator